MLEEVIQIQVKVCLSEMNSIISSPFSAEERKEPPELVKIILVMQMIRIIQSYQPMSCVQHLDIPVGLNIHLKTFNL